MEPIDRELQQRVWQRVQNAAEPERPEGLLLEERTDAVQFRLLGLNSLAAQAKERTAILQGLCRLADIPDAHLLPTASAGSNDNALLRRLMTGLVRRYRRYTALAQQDEYGPVYAALAELTRSTCAQLAKHIGATPLRNSRK